MFNAKMFLTGLAIACLGTFSKNCQAQDFIKHSLFGVEKALKEEKANYQVSKEGDRTIILLAEEGDTAIWKFGQDEICYDYTLVLDKDEYQNVHNHLLLITKNVNERYINIREHTITTMAEYNGQLILNTREFSLAQMIALLKDKPEYADVLALVNVEASTK